VSAARVVYTAEDYDLIESLLDVGLPHVRIAAYLDPPTTPALLRSAMNRAGIGEPWSRGRPTREEVERWDEIEAALRADGGWERMRDAWCRGRIERLAEHLGYDVEVTKKPPEVLAPAVSKQEVSASCAPGGMASIHAGRSW
jgi:hypothetical protein